MRRNGFLKLSSLCVFLGTFAFAAQAAVKVSATALTSSAKTDSCVFTVKITGLAPGTSIYVKDYYYDTIGNTVFMPGTSTVYQNTYSQVTADSKGNVVFNGTVPMSRTDLISTYPDIANIVFYTYYYPGTSQVAPGPLKTNRCY